jgi:gamma-glutamylcyclotransferase (GGCT)/AIG2-like uncharacterized protein YtfP
VPGGVAASGATGAERRLDVFVYGTLKRSQVNHEAFCRGALAVEDAWTRGRLFHLPAGYPALEIAPGCLLAEGTADLAADLALQDRWRERLRHDPPAPVEEPAYPRAFGEWVSFGDPGVRLPRLDRLEVFRPGRRSLYQRVLVLAWVGEADLPRPAWTYVQAQPRGTRVPSGRWPE